MMAVSAIKKRSFPSLMFSDHVHFYVILTFAKVITIGALELLSSMAFERHVTFQTAFFFVSLQAIATLISFNPVLDNYVI